MIKIKQSKTADTRSCDYTSVSKQTLLASSLQHIDDVKKGLDFFREMLSESAANHDFDKITDLDSFHSDFITGFKNTTWYDNHRKINRHHLSVEDGIPKDVNLIDVLEYITDCVMAGKARTGDVFPLELNTEILQKAFNNTVDLLKSNVVVE